MMEKDFLRCVAKLSLESMCPIQHLDCILESGFEMQIICFCRVLWLCH